MKKITLILVSAALFVGGHAFGQEADSTTQIDFETADGQLIPVYEYMKYGPGDSHNSSLRPFERSEALTLAYFAPMSTGVPNGLHKYEMAGVPFVVDAQGSPQRWLYTGENKELNTLGTFVAVGGVVWGAIVLVELIAEMGKGVLWISTVAIFDAATRTHYDAQFNFDYSGLLLQGLGAVTLVVGGAVMTMLARPHGTRIP